MRYFGICFGLTEHYLSLDFLLGRNIYSINYKYAGILARYRIFCFWEPPNTIMFGRGTFIGIVYEKI